jgi:hypothetical protein
MWSNFLKTLIFVTFLSEEKTSASEECKNGKTFQK